MRLIDLHLPIPYILANKNGEIISYTSKADEVFDLSEGTIKSIVDEGSISKFERVAAIPEKSMRFEANLKTRSIPIALFDIHISWDFQGNASMQFLFKDDDNEPLMEKLQALQNRLAKTDFELYEQKETLEKTLQRLDELSGPFISLTKEICYIPLFGDMTGDKFTTIMEQTLARLSDHDYRWILIDLTAVAKVYKEGTSGLELLIKSILLMTGGEVRLIGINPSLAKTLQPYQLRNVVHTEQSLQSFLQSVINDHAI
ncbi:Stressosome protein rsbRB [Cytobacillus sp. OWB-43]|uniref:STAS domain-containing protein n=1 Tax=Cytobacillus sp. OWB-43 TaxID=3108468 RepID=UPI002AFEBE38|nr:STAS domain-containing protein [Cytobacillus sp. OWB-43]MEA1854123.1 Stressosome protein rsbRB [Cytobacillus sp. OWB-43]